MKAYGLTARWAFSWLQDPTTGMKRLLGTGGPVQAKINQTR